MNYRLLSVTIALILAVFQIGCVPARPRTETTVSAGDLAQLRKEQRNLAEQVRQLRDRVGQLEAKMREQRVMIDDLSGAAAPKKGTVAREITLSTPVPEPEVTAPVANEIQDLPPEEVYRKAFSDYAAGRFEPAVQGFTRFLENYPNNEYAGHAQYWLGECFYARQQYDRAVDAFQKTVERYPEAGKTPEALLKMAEALKQLGRFEYAENALQILRSRYPDSAAALRSQENN